MLYLDKLVAGPRKSEIAQGAATLNERLADLEHLERVLERAVQLRPNGTISQAGLDYASAPHAAAVARAESAREALALLQEGSRAEDIATARANLDAGPQLRQGMPVTIKLPQAGSESK